MRTDRRFRNAGVPVAVLALLAVCLVPVASVAQEAAPTADTVPEAREVIDRYVKAIGGKKAVLEPKSLAMSGEFSVPAAGMSGTLRIQTMAPNKMLTEVEIPGLGLIREGFDGDVAWSIDPTMGPRVKEGSELSQTAYQSDFYGALHAEDRYKSMETTGQVEFDGKQCYKLELVTANGDEVVEYYDVDSGLMVGTEMTVESPMGPMQVKQTVGGYEKFGKLSLPTETTVSIGPMQQVLTITDVEHDSVDPAAFELPAEIKALVAE
jgi:hypothetical protein